MIKGNWTRHLRYLGETRTAYVFRPWEPPKPIVLFETQETYFVQKPLPPGLVEFVRGKASWKERTPRM